MALAPLRTTRPRNGRLRWTAWFVGALAAIGGAACSTTPANSTSSTTVTGGHETITVVLDDYRFAPAVLTAGAAGRVRAQNLGGLEHSWAVLADPIEVEADLGTATVLVEARIGVGQSAEVDVSSLPAGRYQVVCTIPGHFSAGMVGELVVGAG